MNCEICNKPVDTTYEDESYADESGLYHFDCWDEETQKEAQKYLRSYKAKAPLVDQADGYDWGHYKNPHYMAWAIDQADAARG